MSTMEKITSRIIRDRATGDAVSYAYSCYQAGYVEVWDYLTDDEKVELANKLKKIAERQAANKEKQKAWEALTQEQKIAFVNKDERCTRLTELRSGNDQYSNWSLQRLSETVYSDAIDLATRPDWSDQDKAAALRWCLRGLTPRKAYSKIRGRQVDSMLYARQEIEQQGLSLSK